MAFDVRKATEWKLRGAFTHIEKVRFYVPPKTRVEVTYELPEDVVLFWLKEKHGDMELGVIQHWCFKDDMPVLPEGMVVSADTLEIDYPIPFLVERYVKDVIYNTSDTAKLYECAAYFAVVPRSEFEKVKREVRERLGVEAR